VEKNQEKVPTVIAMQIEVVQRNKRRTTPLAMDNSNSTPVNRQREGKKPPENSDRGSSVLPVRHLERYKSF